jgi:hypothetical protein
MTEQTIATPVTTTETAEQVSAPITAPLLAGKFTSADELEKAYKNLEKHLGEKRPSAPESYILPDETVALISKDVLDVAKKANITQEQLKTLTDSLVEQHRSLVAAKAQKEQEALTANKQEIDKDFSDKLEERIKGVKAVLHQYAPAELSGDIVDKMVTQDPKLFKFLDKIATDVLKSKTIASDFTQRALTPIESRERLSAFMNDPAKYKALKNPLDSLHAAAKAEYNKILGK